MVVDFGLLDCVGDSTFISLGATYPSAALLVAILVLCTLEDDESRIYCSIPPPAHADHFHSHLPERTIGCRQSGFCDVNLGRLNDCLVCLAL